MLWLLSPGCAEDYSLEACAVVESCLYIFEETSAFLFGIKPEYTWENESTDLSKGGVETGPSAGHWEVVYGNVTGKQGCKLANRMYS
jgi:hypothetical protein